MLVKMLMENDPLPVRGSMVMTMVTISPSRRYVSPAEQLRRSPRLVSPRFRLETAALRPESFLLIFPVQNTLYGRRWASGACQVAHKSKGRAHPPPLWMAGAPLRCFLRPIIFINTKMTLREVPRLLELCRIGL